MGKIPNDYSEIIKKLSIATQEGRVLWKMGSSGPVVELPEMSLEIWEGTDEESRLPFVAIVLRGMDNKQIDTWWVEEKGNERVDYETMKILYDRARRKAHGVDKKLGLLKNLLDQAGSIGTRPEDEAPF